MVICDKCKKPITQSFNKVNFRFVRIVGTELCSDTKKVMMPPTPQQHEITLDICPDCQEKIIKDVLGVTPWEEGK